MSLYISQEQLLKNREIVKQSTSNKIDTFVGIILLLLSSEKITELYYKTNMSEFSNNANSAFTFKDTRVRLDEKYWYALFTPKWANRALDKFLLGNKINIYVLLSTIFWRKDNEFLLTQKEVLKNLIGEENFLTLFDENRLVIYENRSPINMKRLLQELNPSGNNFTIKYDGNFIQKEAGELSGAPFGQTLYSALEVRQIVNVFDFDISLDFKFNPILEFQTLLPSYSQNQHNKKAQNLLLYGVAGVGKSHNISKIVGNNEQFVERIVFHPDYLNTDFIGQIMPTMKDDKIVYDFKAGSFTKILNKAINDPNNHYYLIIEEINRGNAPAIFGEIFQLLDRNENGESSYKIAHEMIAKLVFDDKDRAIFIPSNLTILATMNTADQNVFTLDTAFQRRWTMRMIENNIQECHYKDDVILDTGITWERFNTVINNFILQTNKDSLSSEDKRLGAYFVRQDELKLPENMENGIAFAEKVIKYLWDDVFKFNKSALFDSRFNALDGVLNDFKNKTGFHRFEIFNENIRNQLKQG